jgi:hypothetical protein
MTLEGRIAVDVSFSDSTSSTGVQSLKRLSLTSTDAYSSGKVAVLTGTVGTAAVTLTMSPTTYKDSSGAAVSFTSISRMAFKSSGPAVVIDAATEASIPSDGNAVAVWSPTGNQGDSVEVRASIGTSTYTLVIYGS